MSYAYLASPYSSPDPNVREARYQKAKAAVRYLLHNKVWVYSPIVHCHVVGIEMASEGMPFDFETWKEYDFAMMRSANKLIVLRIEGTDQSRGVAAEKAEAFRLGIPVEYL
jgi:NADH:ubiquinone oxidoreductase subunit B-like Fe-S oxidoreductase